MSEQKDSAPQTANHARLAIVNLDQVEVEICRADERDERRRLSSELDEM